MQLSGYFSELSWSEILRFVELIPNTGRMKIQALDQSTLKSSTRYVWFDNGWFVAATKELNSKELLWLIHQQGHLTCYTANRLAKKCPEGMALGTFLKSQCALRPSEIQQLFRAQVIDSLCQVSAVPEAIFELETGIKLPWQEMTGLRLRVYEAKALNSKFSVGMQHCLNAA